MGQIPDRKKAWIFSGLMHLLVLTFLLFYSLNANTEEKQEEGASVAFGILDESSLGLEANGEQILDPTISDAIPSQPSSTLNEPMPKEDVVSDKASEVNIKSEPSKKPSTKQVVKPTTTPVKETSKPSNSTSNTNTSNNANQDQVNEKKKKFGSLFGSGGQGTKDGNGNQGDQSGNPDSKVLEGISKGRGTVGGGLSGRKIINAPLISESSQKTGRVVIKICVDKNGKVVSAKFTQGGSTTTDSQLVKIAERGAMKYEFVSGEMDSQCGTLTFDFKVS
jgi:TonB family protein